jgi:hypothetical protein
MSNIQINPYNFAAPAGLGSWKELDRTTLPSSNNSILVSGLSNKMYYMILCDIQQVTSNIRSSTRLNADTGSNYATRSSENGGADSPAPNGSYIKNSGSLVSPMFNVQYLSNISSKEKLMLNHNVGQSTAGAGNAPVRMESVGKWANTSSVITSIEQYNDQGGSYDTGSEVVVLGYYPTDTHTDTDNFWQELSSTTLAVAATNFSSGTILAKKYLWVQVSIPSPNHNFNLQFNGDTGNNYAKRRSENGGTDTTSINQDRMTLGSYGSTDSDFYNIFIINNLANEKLAIIKNVNRNTAGAPNAPWRSEFASKWSNTSAQITTIDVLQQSGGAGSFGIGTIMKVWGHD